MVGGGLTGHVPPLMRTANEESKKTQKWSRILSYRLVLTSQPVIHMLVQVAKVARKVVQKPQPRPGADDCGASSHRSRIESRKSQVSSFTIKAGA